MAGGLKSLLYELGVAVPGAKVGERQPTETEEHFWKNCAPSLVSSTEQIRLKCVLST